MAEHSQNSKRLSEEELRVLADQLDKKREILREQEQALLKRELETHEKLEALSARECEFSDEVNNRDEPISTTRHALEAMQNTLSTMINEVSRISREIGSIKNGEGQRQSGPVPRVQQNEVNVRDDRELPANIKFKDALESVPIFNGYNVPVLRFVRACKRARDMFRPHQELGLTQLLRNKLKGHAATALEDYNFQNVHQFGERLKTLFGAAKTLNEFRGELGNISKNKNEHIIDYISRTKDLHTAILEAEIDNHGTLRNGQYDIFENDTLDCFVKGLPPDFRIRLKLEGFDNLEDAYSKAIKVEKDMERDRSHFKDTRFESRTQNQSAQIKAVSPSGGPICKHCNRNHASEDCWSKFPDKRPGNSNKQNSNSRITWSRPTNIQGSRPPSMCNYCNRAGHLETTCFKKQNEERNRATELPKNENSRPVARASPRDEKSTERPVKIIDASPCDPSTSY